MNLQYLKSRVRLMTQQLDTSVLQDQLIVDLANEVLQDIYTRFPQEAQITLSIPAGNTDPTLSGLAYASFPVASGMEVIEIMPASYNGVVNVHTPASWNNLIKQLVFVTGHPQDVAFFADRMYTWPIPKQVETYVIFCHRMVPPYQVSDVDTTAQANVSPLSAIYDYAICLGVSSRIDPANYLPLYEKNLMDVGHKVYLKSPRSRIDCNW